jgi:hypothetical protein
LRKAWYSTIFVPPHSGTTRFQRSSTSLLFVWVKLTPVGAAGALE